MADPDQKTSDVSDPPIAASRGLKSGSRVERRIEAGRILHSLFGDDGVAALKARNWTLTGAVLVVLGVVADLMEIFGRITVSGLLISVLAAAFFGAVVFLRPRWKTACVAPFVSALLFVVMFTSILFVQHSADAADEGVIAKIFPEASAIQRALYINLTSLEDGQEKINAKIDQLTEEIRRVNSTANPAGPENSALVGVWTLQTPVQAGWSVEYRADGTYVLTTPTARVNGIYKAADGWFSSSAPALGSADAGSYRIFGQDTLEMTGKLGVSIWRRQP